MWQSVTLNQVPSMQGKVVRSCDGAAIGRVREVLYDRQTQQPEWIDVSGGVFGRRRLLVPMQGASIESDAVNVLYAKDVIQHEPRVRSAPSLTPEAEHRLCDYFGLVLHSIPDGHDVRRYRVE